MFDETVQHLLAGCEVLARTEYLGRHNNALMVLAVSWAVERERLPANTAWYAVRWEKGHVLKGNGFKLSWDFKHRIRKTSSASRPDLTLEDEKARKICHALKRTSRKRRERSYRSISSCHSKPEKTEEGTEWK